MRYRAIPDIREQTLEWIRSSDSRPAVPFLSRIDIVLGQTFTVFSFNMRKRRVEHVLDQTNWLSADGQLSPGFARGQQLIKTDRPDRKEATAEGTSGVRDVRAGAR